MTRIFQHARRAHQSQLLKEHTKTYDMNTIYEYVYARSVGEAQENNKYLLLFLYFTPLSRQIQLENKRDKREKPRKKRLVMHCICLLPFLQFLFVFYCCLCFRYSYYLLLLLLSSHCSHWLWQFLICIANAALRRSHHEYFPLFKKNFRLR